MELGFLRPWGLLGLLGVAVPIVIHLMERKREVTVRIPTVRFILEAQRRTSRRLKLRRLLLLALRVLMVALLAVLLARPVLTREAALVEGTRPQSTVVIVDDSPSMGWAGEGEARREAARRVARGLVSRLTVRGEAAVLATGGGEVPGGFSRDGDRLAAVVDAIPPSFRPADLAGALNAAWRLMEAAAFRDRQVVLVTDLTRPSWAALDPTRLERPNLGVPVRVVDVSGGREAWNRAVTGLRLSGRPGGGGAGRVSVTASAWGPVPPGEVTLRLDLDGRLAARRLVEVPSGEERVFEFLLPELDGGTHLLEVALDGDPLEVDDRFRGVADFGGRVRVVTVDGAPRASLMDSETWFLRAALVPDRYAGGGRVENTVLLANQLTPAALDAADVLLLANVRGLPDEVARVVARRVGEGMGLMLFPGDNYGAAAWTETFDGGGRDLLPFFPGEVTSPETDATLRRVDTAAEPLTLFAASGSGDFGRARFAAWVRPGPGGVKPGGRVLLALDERGEEPVLVERSAGEGRVLLFSSTADLDWNNLATQPVYLPLVQRCVEYLAGTRGLVLREGAVAGGRARVPLEEEPGGATLAVVTPGGLAAEATIERGGDGSVAAVLAEAGETGFYTVAAGGREVPVAVNLDPAESDVRAAGPSDLARLGGLVPVETLDAAAAADEGEGLRGTVDPSPWLAALLLALLVTEGIVSLGWGRLPTSVFHKAGEKAL